MRVDLCGTGMSPVGVWASNPRFSFWLQVTEADSAANAAIAAAEIHMLALGPLLQAAAGQHALSDKDARAALLTLRTVCLHNPLHPSATLIGKRS